MPNKLGLCAICIALAGQTVAQEQITPSALLDLVEGRTATFVDFESRRLVGVEEFVRRDRSIWARANGTCAYGVVFEEGEQVCFDYDDDAPGVTHCWIPFAQDDRLFVLSVSSSQIQEVAEINDSGVSCEPPALS